MKKTLEVSCAVIVKDGLFFCVKRPNKGEMGLRWEFPGGKLEANETAQEALVREIKEELNTTIKIEKEACVIEHEYLSFCIRLFAFYCSIIEGKLELKEHLESAWLKKEDLLSVNWADADLKIVNKLIG